MTFKAGTSGNPQGRPKGIVDRRSEFRSMLEPHAKDLIDKLVELAKNGEPTALRLCIERLLPRAKADNSIYFPLPEGRLNTGDNMLKIVHDLTHAVASGQINMDEAERFNEFLQQQRHLISQAERKISEEEWEKRRAELNALL
jgi:hypothetical protein